MIASLEGRVAALEPDAVIVDVGGVGYRVYVPTTLIAELGPAGSPVTLRTHLHVRESELTLYGAGDAETVGLFGLLLGVSGVGPKLAMAVLSAYRTSVIQEAIVSEDVAMLTQVSGVGKKTAQRIILDLKGPLEKQGVIAGGASPSAGMRQVDPEAVAALTVLGYSVTEARNALAAAKFADDAGLEERVLAALRAIGGG